MWPVVQFFSSNMSSPGAFGKEWTGIVILAISALFRNVIWPVVQVYFSDIFRPAQFHLQSGYSTKFCLHAAGGIFVKQNFANSGGNIKISGSSAENGGAVLRSSSWVFGRILRWLWALGDQLYGLKIEKNWRDFHRWLQQSLIAN